MILALSRFREGGVWIETEGGQVPLEHKGAQRFGEILKLQDGPKFLSPRRLHHTEEWRGTRVVIIAYTVRFSEKLPEVSRKRAAELGFVLPRTCTDLTQPPNLEGDPAPTADGFVWHAPPSERTPVKPALRYGCSLRSSTSQNLSSPMDFELRPLFCAVAPVRLSLLL